MRVPWTARGPNQSILKLLFGGGVFTSAKQLRKYASDTVIYSIVLQRRAKAENKREDPKGSCLVTVLVVSQLQASVDTGMVIQCC